MEGKHIQKYYSIDNQSTHAMIDAFGRQFYNAKPAEREELAKHISLNFKLQGKFYSDEEVTAKFNGLRRTYNRYRKELESGQEVQWEFYEELDKLLREKFNPRPRKKMDQRSINNEQYPTPDGSPTFSAEPAIELLEFASVNNSSKRPKLDSSTSNLSSALSSSYESAPNSYAQQMYSLYNQNLYTAMLNANGKPIPENANPTTNTVPINSTAGIGNPTMTNPYSFVNFLKENTDKKLDVVTVAQALSFATANQHQFNFGEASTSKSNPSAIGSGLPFDPVKIVPLIQKLLDIQAEQVKTKEKRQALEKTEEELTTAANHQMTLILMGLMGIS